MPFAIACPGCAKQFRVADEHAGKQVKCPACATVFQVPATQTAFTPEQAATPKRPLPRDSSAAPPSARSQTPFSPQPAQATASGSQTTTFVQQPAKPPDDSGKSLGVISLVLGILSLVGELASMMSVFFGGLLGVCCFLCLPLGFVGVIAAPILLIPAGIGLALGFKAQGGLKTTGIALNAIALALGVITLVGMLVMILIFGGLAALQPQPVQQVPF